MVDLIDDYFIEYPATSGADAIADRRRASLGDLWPALSATAAELLTECPGSALTKCAKIADTTRTWGCKLAGRL